MKDTFETFLDSVLTLAHYRFKSNLPFPTYSLNVLLVRWKVLLKSIWLGEFPTLFVILSDNKISITFQRKKGSYFEPQLLSGIPFFYLIIRIARKCVLSIHILANCWLTFFSLLLHLVIIISLSGSPFSFLFFLSFFLNSM